MRAPHAANDDASLDLYQLTRDLRARAWRCPCWCAFPDILQHRVRRIIGGFDQAREKLGYENGYTLLYPIKVNQQEAVIKA